MNGTGRSGSGRLRNFAAMNDGKLTKVYLEVVAEDDDPEARERLDAELAKRGLEAGIEGLDYDEEDLA